MTHIFRGTKSENAKWRISSNRAAAALKQMSVFSRDPMKLGFAFDDGVVTLEIAVADIKSKSGKDLADFIYQLVVTATQDKSKPS